VPFPTREHAALSAFENDGQRDFDLGGLRRSWRSVCYRRSAGGHGLAEKLIAEDAERAEYVDLPRGIVRIAAFRNGRIEACVFCGPAQNSPHWDVVRALFDSAVAERDRRLLLSGRSAEGVAETGPIVCAGFGVGLEAIRRAITLGTAATVAEIGKALRAGANCGSCMPELHGVVERTAAAAARNDG